MRYPPLPGSAVPTVVAVTTATLLGIVWGTWTSPAVFWAPGDLSRFHVTLTRCTGCHEPFRGPISSRCVTCHAAETFEQMHEPSRGSHLNSIRRHADCRWCHTEHRGSAARITDGLLDHPHGDVIFLTTGAKACSTCHVFERGDGEAVRVLDNAAVRALVRRGRGSHRFGAFASCGRCHEGMEQRRPERW